MVLKGFLYVVFLHRPSARRFETTGSRLHPVQTPFVVFANGLERTGDDAFTLWYGAGDTNVGAARLRVRVPLQQTVV